MLETAEFWMSETYQLIASSALPSNIKNVVTAAEPTVLPRIAARSLAHLSAGHGVSSRRGSGLRKARPQRGQVGFIRCCYSLGERAAIENSGHHAGEAGRVGLAQERNEHPGLPVSHPDAKRRVWDYRR